MNSIEYQFPKTFANKFVHLFFICFMDSGFSFNAILAVNSLK